MAKIKIRKRADGWWHITETDSSVREDGPFATRADARRSLDGFPVERVSQPQRKAGRAPKPTRYLFTPLADVVPLSDAERAAMIARYRPLFNRVDASDLELAAAVREMSHAGVSQTEMERALGGRKQTWFSYMFRLSMIPDSLIAYLRTEQISTTALIKGVDRLGVATMERTIPVILEKHRRQGVLARITEKELYENAVRENRAAV